MAILDQGYGYGFAVGLGAGFALLMALITRVLSKYLGQKQNSERFSTASRNVGSGLIASSTVSAWNWPATLLTSSGWAYAHGVGGGYMYGVGGIGQITLFLFLALQLKRKAPSAHTVSECFYLRYGKVGHWVFLFYCMSTNVLISALLLLGGCQGFAATTGMHVVAASFLLPLGVIVYTALGGLKATFVSDWIHTVIIYLVLIIAVYTIYCTSPLIGSPGRMYDLLKEAQDLFPNPTGQSYLSFNDPTLFYLTWSATFGGLSSVLGDPGYSQRAIASDPTQVFVGYLSGGLCWVIIPVSLGMSAGLACRALITNPVSVTYPDILTDFEVGSGLPMVYGLAAIFGKSGAAAGLLILFMSVTSATSAELIAFSSVTTYDIYRTYINPNASGKQLVRCSHISVVLFGLFMAALAVGFNYAGVTVGWLLGFTGIILTPEVSAVVFTLFWNRLTKKALVIGAPLGTVTGIACWIGSTYHYGAGVIDRDTLGIPQCTFIGNITALGSTPLYMLIISFLFPDAAPFDMRKLNDDLTLGDDVDREEALAVKVSEETSHKLKKQTWLAILCNVVLLLGCYVIVPTALLGTKYELTKSGFTALVVIIMIWLIVAALFIIFMPLWQGRESLKALALIFMGKRDRVEIETAEISDDTKSSNESEELRGKA